MKIIYSCSYIIYNIYILCDSFYYFFNLFDAEQKTKIQSQGQGQGEDEVEGEGEREGEGK